MYLFKLNDFYDTLSVICSKHIGRTLVTLNSEDKYFRCTELGVDDSAMEEVLELI